MWYEEGKKKNLFRVCGQVIMLHMLCVRGV